MHFVTSNLRRSALLFGFGLMTVFFAKNLPLNQIVLHNPTGIIPKQDASPPILDKDVLKQLELEFRAHGWNTFKIIHVTPRSDGSWFGIAFGITESSDSNGVLLKTSREGFFFDGNGSKLSKVYWESVWGTANCIGGRAK